MKIRFRDFFFTKEFNLVHALICMTLLPFMTFVVCFWDILKTKSIIELFHIFFF